MKTFLHSLSIGAQVIVYIYTFANSKTIGSEASALGGSSEKGRDGNSYSGLYGETPP